MPQLESPCTKNCEAHAPQLQSPRTLETAQHNQREATLSHLKIPHAARKIPCATITVPQFLMPWHIKNLKGKKKTESFNDFRRLPCLGSYSVDQHLRLVVYINNNVFIHVTLRAFYKPDTFFSFFLILANWVSL